MKHLFILLVKGYQAAISPWKRPCCRFSPTCSTYAIEAFGRFGAVRGLILTVWRILRCNPFCRGGYDPVPEKFTLRRKKTDSENKFIGEPPDGDEFPAPEAEQNPGSDATSGEDSGERLS